jgi:hypothetical protein
MALPKKLVKNISLTSPKILTERREELLEQIQKDGTYLPKGILHADLDRGMLDFVKNDLGISVDGKQVNTVDVIVTTQNWSQFTQTWNFQYLDTNISPPFVTTVRKPEVPYGSNPAVKYRIPGRPQFQYAAVPTFDGQRNGMDIYTIPEPTPVDITYEVKIFCNRLREINEFNKKIMKTFGSRQAYTLIKGRYIPIILDSINDESVVELQKRRYFIQTYVFKMLGYIIDEADFKVKPAVSRTLTMFDTEIKTKSRFANSEIGNPDSYDKVFNFLGNNNTLTDTIDLNYDLILIKTNNVSSFDVTVNGNYIGSNVPTIMLNNGDILVITVTKDIINTDASILFNADFNL